MNALVVRIVLAATISLLAVGQLSAQQPAWPAGLDGWVAERCAHGAADDAAELPARCAECSLLRAGY